MAWTREELRIFLNEELAGSELARVVDEIEQMSQGFGLRQSTHPEELLQGDVYADVACIDRYEREVTIVPRRVMLVSNSCDTSRENIRKLPIHFTVAPALRIDRLRDMLVENGVEEATVTAMIASIKAQEKPQMIYLPSIAGEADLVVLLDQVQSMHADDFASGNPFRLSVMTQRGFWVLLLKLSIHFCRQQENVARDAA